MTIRVSDLKACRHCLKRPDLYGSILKGRTRHKVSCRCGYEIIEDSLTRAVRRWNKAMEDDDFWNEYDFPEYDGPGKVHLILSVTRKVWHKNRPNNGS